MKRLVDTVQELSLARDIESVMLIVRTVARELTGADGATFVLRDNGFCYYADEDAISPLWKGSRFPMETCISGWVMLNKKPVLIRDIYLDDRIPADAYRPTFVKSLAMVPIRTLAPIGAIGNYWADYHVPSEEEVALLQALADITAVSIENIEVRNTLEDKVRERTQELLDSLDREKELNTLKSAFVSMASHEFRTPLGTILSSTSLVEKYTETDQQDKREKHLTRIKSTVKDLVQLLDDFLSIDQLEHGKMETRQENFDLQHFLLNIVNDLDGIRKNRQVIHYTHLGEKEVQLDTKILRNVLFNLLSNAIKYSDKDIDLNATVQEGMITIRVTDQGIGIPEEQQKNMFSKFFRASNTFGIQGTGLGMNIVKHYVELLGGTIDFTSCENKGTTFTVLLPNAAGITKAEVLNASASRN
ncbi:MAG: GAF domain-containing sensor histidine kinase [Bacteroidetes bacterium]|nr:GAF domain-containing sensor histidine kinase [Bacteroidota bacterium]